MSCDLSRHRCSTPHDPAVQRASVWAGQGPTESGQAPGVWPLAAAGWPAVPFGPGTNQRLVLLSADTAARAVGVQSPVFAAGARCVTLGQPSDLSGLQPPHPTFPSSFSEDK